MSGCRCRGPSGDLIRTAAVALAALAALAAVAPAAASPPGGPATVADATRDGIVATLGSYEFTVNGQPAGDTVFAVRPRSGPMLLEEAALRRWGVSLPDGAETVEVGGVRLVSLGALAGARADVDESRQAVSLTVPPAALNGTRFDLRPQVPGVERPRYWGGFFNYSLFSQWNERGADTASGLFELGTFGPYGAGLLSAVANPSTRPEQADALVRLDTAWRIDRPGTLQTLTIGDSFTRTGTSFGRPVRFGGIQFGTNFGLQPGFIAYPLQAVQGTAVLPSTVDVFLDQTRIGTQQVPPGPFSITNVPAVNGAGQVQVVVRDLFGRETVLTQSLYGTPLLLARGVTDYSVSLGAERFDYGLKSFEYSGHVASGYLRHGLTDALTLEGRLDADRRVTMAGASTDVRLGLLGIATLGGAVSSGDDGEGSALLAGFDRRTQGWGAGVRGYLASEGFRQVGDTGIAPLASQVSANAAFDLGSRGSIGVVAARQTFHGPQPPLVSATATWSVALRPLVAFANVSVSHSESFTRSTAVLLSLSVPLQRSGTNLGATLGTTRTAAGTETLLAATALKPPPYYAEGVGWRAYADTDRRYEAAADVNLPAARLAVGASSTPFGSAARALVEGGFGTVGGYAFVSRPIRDSFAVVSVGGVPGVKVMQENQPVGVTDDRGVVVLERVLAYGFNTVSIDPETTPIGVSVDAVKRNFSPGWRSGELIEFPVRRERNAVVKVLLASGEPVPAGAAVTVEGVEGATVTGHGGRVFVVGLPDAGARMSIALPGGPCVVSVEGGAGAADAVPVLGPYTCGAQAR